MESSRGKEGTSWENVDTLWEISNFFNGMWEHFTLKRAEAKKILEDAERERQEGIQGQAAGVSFQGDSGAGQRTCRYGLWLPNVAERLYRNKGWQVGRVQRRMQRKRELIRMHPRENMRSLRESGERCSWTFGYCAGNPEKKYGLLEADHCASRWKGRSHPVVYLPALQQFSSLEDYIWWVPIGHGDRNNRKKRHCSWWCAVCGGKYEWRAPNRTLVVQLGMRQKFSERTRSHKEFVKI